MLLSDWRVLVRRWYVVAIGLLVTAALCWAATQVVPPQYQVKSTFVLLPPRTLVDGKPTNPYLNLGGMDGISDVMTTALLDTSVGESLTRAGLDAEYKVSRDLSLAGPVLVVEVQGATPTDALRTQQLLLSRVPESLKTLQEQVGVARGGRITSNVITQDRVPQISRKSQYRILLVVGFGGLAATYLTAAVVDGIRLSRRQGPIGAARPLMPRSDPPADRGDRQAWLS